MLKLDKMKRFIVVIAAIVLTAGFSVKASAQDIILTKDSQIIKAYVQEITEDTVSYTKADNPKGPTYKIGVAKLQKIIFENGTEEVFTTTATEPVPVQSPVNRSTTFDSSIAVGTLDYSHGDVILAGRKLTSSEMQQIMPEDMFNQARGGQKMRGVGKGLLIPGAILTGVSIACCTAALILASDVTDYEDVDEVYAASGIAIASSAIGVPMLGAGVALYCVGQGRTRRAVDDYNEAYKQNYSFNIGSTRNGVGVFLNF